MFEAYKDKRVFITGHTGFKGSWLCEMLLMAGAEVYGYALKPPTKPSLFAQLKLAKRIKSHVIGDVRDLKSLTAAIRAAKPDYVFHLAAQPLVRESYRVPVETFDTNVMGTVNVLEAVRRVFLSTNCTNSTNCEKEQSGRRNSCNSCNSWTTDGAPCSVVCITTDKVYENDNLGKAFKEGDPLGGRDPYSASKGACEIAIASYRRSFFSAVDCPVKVASARAGNVIGGGDWAADRIVPDAMRAFLSGRTLTVRNRKSTRPWQHVLEPLCGYLMLGEWLSTNFTNCTNFEASGMAFNFGPDEATVKTVGQLVTELKRHFPKAQVADRTDPKAPKEAKLLRLDSGKAKKELGWRPHWDFRRTIAATAEWYRQVGEGKVSAWEMTDRQIGAFLSTNFTNCTN